MNLSLIHIWNGWDGDRTAAIRAMADQIRHRGPDQDDYYVDDEIAMGFRRLSIIDLEGGSQPIQNEDGSKVLTFNGEIYNFQELRGELLEKGHRFKTKTDSEVLLHGYEAVSYTHLMCNRPRSQQKPCPAPSRSQRTNRRTRRHRGPTGSLPVNQPAAGAPSAPPSVFLAASSFYTSYSAFHAGYSADKRFYCRYILFFYAFIA